MYRLRTEYGAEPRLDAAPFSQIRWFAPGTRREQMDDDYLGNGVRLAEDVRGQIVVLFPEKWSVDYFVKKHPELPLHTVSPHAIAPAG
jgi:peptide chain release factor 3